MKLKKLGQIDWAFIAVFISYVFDFGNIKYALAAFFSLFYLLLMGVRERHLSMTGIGKSFRTIMVSIVVLAVITLLLQVFNGFQSYAVNEMIYFVAPLMVIWVYASNTDKDTMGRMLNILFYICAAHFLYRNVPLLTIENLKSISFLDSFSVFESGSAYLMIVFEWLFLTKGERKKAILALGICILSFKRLCMIAAILIFLFQKVVAKKAAVKKDYVYIAVVIFVLLPILTGLILTDDFLNWFYTTFGVSLAKLTLSRSDRIIMVMQSDEINHGLGSTTVYLTKIYQAIHKSEVEQWNLHNDLVRIYVECGIIGSVVFTYGYLKAAAFQRPTFILMIYIFIECYVSHLFGAGSVTFWLVTYLAMAYAAADQGMADSAQELQLKGQHETSNSLYTNLRPGESSASGL